MPQKDSEAPPGRCPIRLPASDHGRNRLRFVGLQRHIRAPLDADLGIKHGGPMANSSLTPRTTRQIDSGFSDE
ncbi:MAG: hypothetical protein QOG95_3687 [Mycobacterium sp.]|nr:hypothetical protein [Mycobacterium sp.]